MNNVGIAVGIFDMVSLDKVNFLNAAATKCDSLTVGVLSDSVAEQLTGKTPVFHAQYRNQILNEFKSVNKVILIDDINDIDALFNEFDFAFLYDDVKNCNKINHSAKSVDVEIACNNKNLDDYTKVKQLKGTVGYTTGVYDLFHIGHLNLIKRAKENCDSLIVGVSTDELVKQYKNKAPNMSFAERIQIIENLKCVDAVVIQKNMDKFEAWKNLKFDIIFHGDDWKGSSLYKETEKKLEAVGVKMVYFPYTKGISSTILSEKILKK